jgi:hypothetical protein
MKFLFAVALFLICLSASQISRGQDSAILREPDPRLRMQDTTIYLEGKFVVRNVYALKDSLTQARIWASKMRDTTVSLEALFVVTNRYAEKDSLEALGDGPLSKKDSLMRAVNDSLSAIGSALMHTADMQDTTITLDSRFVVSDVYARSDSLNAIKDSARALLVRAATLQDTTIDLDPSFVVTDIYAAKDLKDSFRDSVRQVLALAATMQDTTIELERSFIVRNVYAQRDRLEEIRDSLARPMMMQDTLIVLDASFIIRDLYPQKDSMDAFRDSLTALTDSLFTDSVNRHWAGWTQFVVNPERVFSILSNSVLKGKTKTELQYNVADFYLYLNGAPVSPPDSENNFFAAAFLGFKYNDTLLLNSGLGARVGIGVGIKVMQERFTSSLHANTHNTEIYKTDQEDSVYLPSITVEPVTQSLVLKYYPDGSRNEVLIGEYQATYKTFYQKNEDGQDEARKYNVRIVFRCRVSGGINSF